MTAPTPEESLGPFGALAPDLNGTEVGTGGKVLYRCLSNRDETQATAVRPDNSIATPDAGDTDDTDTDTDGSTALRKGLGHRQQLRRYFGGAGWEPGFAQHSADVCGGPHRLGTILTDCVDSDVLPSLKDPSTPQYHPYRHTTNQLAGQATEIAEISSRIPQSVMIRKISKNYKKVEVEDEEGFGIDNVKNKRPLLRSTNKLSLSTAGEKP
ncbi:hypothetical protein OEA41_009665 [Lepraria neglecta]|uniref:Uncharacterized protein n=1 Tax=Lepraria neglecta TaxID=209136 RepID=A0AAE0DKF2_9LECA|nr:hypothetical protein OEA41_009665 [Lepraria neglecta]